MHNYNKGARFERQIIHDLISLNPLIVMRGGGSKSYGPLKADILAIFPSGYLLVIQAKNSKSKFKKEHDAFMSQKSLKDLKVIYLWATPDHYKQDLREIGEVVRK